MKMKNGGTGFRVPREVVDILGLKADKNEPDNITGIGARDPFNKGVICSIYKFCAYNEIILPVCPCRHHFESIDAFNETRRKKGLKTVGFKKWLRCFIHRKKKHNEYILGARAMEEKPGRFRIETLKKIAAWLRRTYGVKAGVMKPEVEGALLDLLECPLPGYFE